MRENNIFFFEYKKIFLYTATILICFLIGIKIYGFELGILLLLLVIIFFIIYFLFFKNNKLCIGRIIIPLLMTSILLPSLPLSESLPDVRLDFIVIFIAWILFIFGGFVKGESLHIQINPTFKWYILFSFTILVSIFFNALFRSYYPIARDFWEFVKLLKYFSIFTLIGNLNISNKNLRYYYKIALLMFAISSIIAIIQYFNLFNLRNIILQIYTPGEALILTKTVRTIGTMTNPNEFGSIMVMASALAFSGLLFYKKKLIRLYSFFCMIIFFFSIIISSSRTAIVLYIIAIFYIIYAKYPLISTIKRKRTMIKLLLLLFVVLFIFTQITKLMPERYMNRIETLRDPFIARSWQGKIRTWTHVFIFIEKSPLFGWGPGKTQVGCVDNEWILIMYRYGILGLCFFILWINSIMHEFYIIRKNFQTKEIIVLTIGLQTTLIIYLINMVVASFYYSIQTMSIISIFFGLAFSQYRKRESNKV